MVVERERENQKMMMEIEDIEEEEERESFIGGSGKGYGNGMVATAVMVVEYLISSMSRDLLCKFPDNSAFDFDYTQSSIWSPLVPRHFPNSPQTFSTTTQRKLSYEDDEETETGETPVLRKLKTKISTSCMFNHFNINHMMIKKKKKTKKKKNGIMGLNKIKKNIDAGFDNFSPIKAKVASITPRKGWAKVLKAASRHFKKKGKDSAARRLSIPSASAANAIIFPPTSFY